MGWFSRTGVLFFFVSVAALAEIPVDSPVPPMLLSAPASPLILAPPPLLVQTAPTGLIAVASKEAIHLTWLPAMGKEGSYAVLRSEASGGSYVTLAFTSETDFADITAELGVTYFYVVRATYPGGNSLITFEVKATRGLVMCPEILTLDTLKKCIEDNKEFIAANDYVEFIRKAIKPFEYEPIYTTKSPQGADRANPRFVFFAAGDVWLGARQGGDSLEAIIRVPGAKVGEVDYFLPGKFPAEKPYASAAEGECLECHGGRRYDAPLVFPETPSLAGQKKLKVIKFQVFN